jgi:hypothetical protein
MISSMTNRGPLLPAVAPAALSPSSHADAVTLPDICKTKSEQTTLKGATNFFLFFSIGTQRSLLAPGAT